MASAGGAAGATAAAATGVALDRVFKEVSVRKLYKDLLVMARYLGQRQGNEPVLRAQVRAAFRANAAERDPARLAEQKEAAMRALSNCYFQEAERLARSPGGGAAGAVPRPPGGVGAAAAAAAEPKKLRGSKSWFAGLSPKAPAAGGGDRR
jgi:hypothetical protein